MQQENIVNFEYNLEATMNRLIKVTIGICVRNCEDIIIEAINSIDNQDFPHKFMEVIFVDDGSNDNTLNIIKEYSSRLDMQVKIFKQEWKGLGETRNVVVNNACGEYIIWVDGDMTLSYDFVRKQVEFMDINRTIGIGKGMYNMSSQGNLVGDLENMDFLVNNTRLIGKAGSMPLGAGGSIYRVNAIKQVGSFKQEITGSGEDMDLELRVSIAGWLLAITPATFCEKRRNTWHALWGEYLWHGKGAAYMFKKQRHVLNSYNFLRPIESTSLFSRIVIAYKLTRRKMAFLLLFHYFFKRIAWFLGFTKELIEIHGK